MDYYGSYIEGVSSFIDKVKNFQQRGVMLGIVLGSYFDDFPDDSNYYDELLKSSRDFGGPISAFFNTYSPESAKEIHKKKGENAYKYCSREIYSILSMMMQDKLIRDNLKEDLFELISTSEFSKFGFLLKNHYSYANLTSCTLKDFDTQLYKIFALDPGFTIKFEHVLRYYKYTTKEEDDTPEIDESVYRFNYIDYMALRNEEKLLPAPDPDLQNVPFFQIGHGKELFKFEHETRCRYLGFLPDPMQSIEFHSAIIISNVEAVMPCEKQEISKNMNQNRI